MPVVAVAIAALPAVALLLAVVTRMESAFFGNGLLDDARLRDAYLGVTATPDPVGAAGPGEPPEPAPFRPEVQQAPA